jgi:hypothetical protein
MSWVVELKLRLKTGLEDRSLERASAIAGRWILWHFELRCYCGILWCADGSEAGRVTGKRFQCGLGFELKRVNG